jgi:hypothetical protein
MSHPKPFPEAGGGLVGADSVRESSGLMNTVGGGSVATVCEVSAGGPFPPDGETGVPYGGVTVLGGEAGSGLAAITGGLGGTTGLRIGGASGGGVTVIGCGVPRWGIGGGAEVAGFRTGGDWVGRGVSTVG